MQSHRQLISKLLQTNSTQSVCVLEMSRSRFLTSCYDLVPYHYFNETVTCFKRERRTLIACYSLHLYPVFHNSKKKTKHITLHIILICVKYNTVASPTLLRLIVTSSSRPRLFLPPTHNQGYLIFLPQFPCPYLFLQEWGVLGVRVG
jgi:hypothetical protein